MDHAATMRRMYELLSAGDIDGFGDLVAEDFVEHDEVPGMEPTKEGVKQLFRMYTAAFPDLRMEPLDILVSGNKVVARDRGTGTHQGDFMGLPATGKSVDVQLIDATTPLRPLCTRESPLRIRRSSDSITGTGERDKQGVALFVDLVAAVRREHFAQQRPMQSQDGRVPLRTKLSEKRGRPSTSVNSSVTVPVGCASMFTTISSHSNTTRMDLLGLSLPRRPLPAYGTWIVGCVVMRA